MTEKRCWSPPDSCGHSLTLSYRPELALIELALGCPTTPTFSIYTLEAFKEAIDDIRLCCRRTVSPFRYVNLISTQPGVFSMGGDLQTIARLAREQNLTETLSFGHNAAFIIHQLWDGFGLDLITTACVSGKAYGAGFEAALACNRMVAHRDATFCLPESRFGLFPGMGATSLLERRLGRPAMEAMIEDRRIVTAEAAFRDGLIEQLTDGDPVAAELDAIAAGGLSRWSMLMDQQRARRAREAFSLDEVLATTTRWAESVVSLEPDALAALNRVANAQKARSRAVPR